jgi:hypothetical protein
MYDVKNHDWSASEEQLQSVFRAFSLRYESWVGELLKYSFYGPDYVRYDYPGAEVEFAARWRGNVISADAYNTFSGNRSGVPVTSIIAKAWGAFYSLFGLWKRGDLENSDEDINRCLRGAHPKANVLNAGDNIIIVNLQGQNDPISNYMKLAVLDETHTFLGWVPIQGSGATTWLPNPESAVKKFLLADSSIGSNNRPYWADGWFRRCEYFAANPAAAEAIRIMNIVTSKHFGWKIDDVAKRYYASPNIPMENWSDSDVKFALNPEYIHYRMDVESVNPELLERVFKLYSPEDTTLLTNAMRRPT